MRTNGGPVVQELRRHRHGPAGGRCRSARWAGAKLLL